MGMVINNIVVGQYLMIYLCFVRILFKCKCVAFVCDIIGHDRRKYFVIYSAINEYDKRHSGLIPYIMQVQGYRGGVLGVPIPTW